MNAVDLSQILIKNPVTILTVFIYLMKWDWFFTISSIVIFPLCIGPVMYVGRRVRKSGANEEAMAGSLMVTMHEGFSGIRVVKSYGREELRASVLTRRTRACQRTSSGGAARWAWSADGGNGRVARNRRGTHLCVEAGHGGAGVHHRRHGPDARLCTREGAQPCAAHLAKSIVATSSVFEMMEQEPDVKDAPDAVTIKRARGEVRLNKITFHYQDPNEKKIKKAAVQDINLHLEPSKFYALVGPSGAGKSTLFNLLLRFYDANQG